MSPTNFKYCAMLVYRLKLSARADPGQVVDGFQLGLCVCTIVEWEIKKITTAPSVGLKGLYFYYTRLWSLNIYNGPS